jgi:SAM-dependent methyltransferase
MNAAAFWNAQYETTAYSRQLTPDMVRALDAALAHFGDVRGKTVLDFGCGMGATSAYLADHGAEVIAADISGVAIRHVDKLRISSVHGVLISKPFLGGIGRFDYVFGAMILHHLEPFADFAAELASRNPAKGFFYENNAASRLLVWFRNHVVGKLWVPKYGDPDEFPLTPQEIDLLPFAVEVEYPELYFWKLASAYLLKHRLWRQADALDALFYRRGWLLPYSYRQYVKLAQH